MQQHFLHIYLHRLWSKDININMRVKELIEKLKAMPQEASVIFPSSYGKWSYAKEVTMGIFYPYSMEYVEDGNDEDEVNSVLIK